MRAILALLGMTSQCTGLPRRARGNSDPRRRLFAGEFTEQTFAMKFEKSTHVKNRRTGSEFKIWISSGFLEEGKLFHKSCLSIARADWTTSSASAYISTNLFTLQPVWPHLYASAIYSARPHRVPPSQPDLFANFFEGS